MLGGMELKQIEPEHHQSQAQLEVVSLSASFVLFNMNFDDFLDYLNIFKISFDLVRCKVNVL